MFVIIKLILIVLSIIVAISAFVAHLKRKARMRRALGHKVKESDMTSINSWIQVVENEGKQRS